MVEIKVKDVKKGMENITLVLRVVSIGDVRTVNTKYGESKVATAIVEDDTGRINLTLWRDQINKIKEGDRIKIEGAFVREFRGELNLNVGKSGRITVLK
jgi:OB-fold nucleic acid binding domain.